jgi:hypothetical protein
MLHQSLRITATSGANISRTSVAMWPELTAAIVTGEIAYRKAAGIDIQRLDVSFFNKLKHEYIMSKGAVKKNMVIKNLTLPKTARDAIAVTTTHGGVARDEPIPT